MTYLLVRIHVWIVDHGPREVCTVLVSRASKLGSAKSAGSQSLVLGCCYVHMSARRVDGGTCASKYENSVLDYRGNGGSGGVCHGCVSRVG